MTIGVRVINVKCTKQDGIALSAIQSELYKLITRELGRVPCEDKENRSGYEMPCTRSPREMYDENVDRGGLGWRTVAGGFGHWSDHWGGPVVGSPLDDGCCVARVLYSIRTCQLEMYT